jgi:hypothetical protein
MSWRCDFRHLQHPWRDSQELIDVGGDVPPAAIRRRTTFAGVPAFDVYFLSDSEPWPEAAVFTYAQTVTSATDLPADVLPYTIDL